MKSELNMNLTCLMCLALHLYLTQMRIHRRPAQRQGSGGWDNLPVRTVQKGAPLRRWLGGLFILCGGIHNIIHFAFISWELVHLSSGLGPPSFSLELTIRCQCVRECHPFHIKYVHIYLLKKQTISIITGVFH